MNENEHSTFITDVIEQSNVSPNRDGVHEDDDDLDIDVKSSADSGDTAVGVHEIDEILNKNPADESQSAITTHPPVDLLPDKM